MKNQLLTAIAFIFLFTACAGTSKKVEQAKLDTNIPVVITTQGTYLPNTVGGVDFKINLVNTSNKTIKYIDLWLAAKNRVGDFVSDAITNKKVKIVQIVGPIQPGNDTRQQFGFMSRWENVWYNHDIVCGGVVGVKITYMDGEEKKFDYPAILLDTGECNNASSSI